MGISYQILGGPGRDNALLVRIESGQSTTNLLFDCGQDCLALLSVSEIHAIDHLFFSHLHMDHVAGFDRFFRCTFNRTDRPNMIWGPPGTAEILQHRFQGFWWNLIAGQEGTWVVNDIDANQVKPQRFEIADAFAVAHHVAPRSFSGVIVETDGFRVEAVTLNHNGPCCGYLVQEKPRDNVRTQKLQEHGWPPGPWLQRVKDRTDQEPIEVTGRSYPAEELREVLLETTPGQSIAYLTDFLLDSESEARLAEKLQGCTTLVCESQYRQADEELARRYHHATTASVARLAERAQVGKLVLFHLSDRYKRSDWLEMLVECREVFSEAYYPDHWEMSDA